MMRLPGDRRADPADAFCDAEHFSDHRLPPFALVASLQSTTAASRGFARPKKHSWKGWIGAPSATALFERANCGGPNQPNSIANAAPPSAVSVGATPKQCESSCYEPNRMLKNSSVIPGRPVRAGPGTYGHRPTHWLVALDSGLAGSARAPE